MVSGMDKVATMSWLRWFKSQSASAWPRITCAPTSWTRLPPWPLTSVPMSTWPRVLLTASETVLRMMDGRYAGAMGLFVLTSERILFRPRRGTGPAFSVPLPDVLAIEAATRRVSGTVRVTTPDGSLTVDRILGTQGDARRGRTGGDPRQTPARA